MKRYGSIAALSRREFLLTAAVVPSLTCLCGIPALADEEEPRSHRAPYLALTQYIQPGNDEFAGEKEAARVREAWQQAVRSKKFPGTAGISPVPVSYRALAPDVKEAVFDRAATDVGAGWETWVESLGSIERIQFYVLPGDTVRYEVKSRAGTEWNYRVGFWKQRWDVERLVEFAPVSEHVASAQRPWFRDVTATALSSAPQVGEQLLHGIPYWRAKLDPASGIEIYGSNGIAVGDIDGDGADEVFVCQPGGLPNRLLKFGPDGKFVDLTTQWGVGLLDDTSCALFLDLRNSGRQDLVVLRSSGPVLYLNEGQRYRLRTDAFRFATEPKGGFTGMAAADFDRDGKLDLYLCCYVYFQSEAQYTYAAPYHDARNGPPNFLFRNNLNNDGSGAFTDCTTETGMMENNDRFSFAPAWCDYNGDGWPDLYVANDFGRKNLYKNDRGRFHDVAPEAGVEDVGPGMSASWFDHDGDGRPDLYVANMWTDAGQRVVRDPHFAPAQANPEAYQGHTMGNSLFRNRGDGRFEDRTAAEHAGFGRWAWAAGGHDLDNDGQPELFVTCGMLTNESEVDLNGFFWRQVVARSPLTAAASPAYENGWNALNQFVRQDYSWSGHEPNVVHVRRGERYFDFSGVSGLDFAEDGRAFAVADFDGDGRPDILLKSRLGPQLRVLQNDCSGQNQSIAFRLQGTKSNRDAIGVKVEVDGRVKWLEAGSGFLSQHSKTLLFGTGSSTHVNSMRITWPSGAVQEFRGLACGRTYSISEGSQMDAGAPFRERRGIESDPARGNNELKLHDTWLLEPVPLPRHQNGPGLFVLRESTPEFEIFRRYLFDWRTSLKLPFAMLLNNSGDVVKVYEGVPSDAQSKRDLAQLRQLSPHLCLPFSGEYLTPPRRDFFKFGAAFLWAGFDDEALPYLQRVLERTPENPRVLVLVAQIHFQGQRFGEAEKYFRQAHELNPLSVPALLGLASVADKRNDQDGAASWYAKALQAEPGSAEAANGLGLLMAKQGRTEQARTYFEKAIARRRDYSDAINNLGVLYTNEGKVNDAIAAFQYGIQVAPDEDILYLNLGRMYVKLGQTDKARAIMQELLDRKPENATARQALRDLNGR
jgi:Flp pilus assembly protein TadD